MRIILLSITFFFLVGVVNNLYAQDRFRNCSAAFLDDRMIVTEYTDNGICRVSKSSSGTLTVQTANLSPEESKPTGKLSFRIAIQDGETKTIWSFSGKSYKVIPIRDVLMKCKVGDRIVLMTVEDEYALPHSIVDVVE